MRKIALIFFLFLIFLAPAYCQERITFFRSDITIRPDGRIDVEETISVMAEGDKIKHGIYRDLPDMPGFSLSRITCNGLNVGSFQKHSSYGKRIYIGDAQYDLPPGKHTYTIDYSVSGEVEHLEDNDRLIWNVTGNAWDFSIDQVVARINLPSGALFDSYTAYTGRYGQQGGDFRCGKEGRERVVFETTRVLSAGEGITIKVTWPKGFVVKEPTLKEQAQGHVDNRSDFQIPRLRYKENAFFIDFWLAVLFVYYLIIWFMFGLDPRKGTVIPLYEPPENISPARMRYAKHKCFDMKMFTAAVLNIAVKGSAVITREGSTYVLTLTGKNREALSPDEEVIAHSLFFSRGKIELDTFNRQNITDTVSYFKEYFEKNHANEGIVQNKFYLMLGAGLFTVAAFFAVSGQNAADALVRFFALCLCFIPMFFVFKFLIKAPTIKYRKFLDAIEGFKLYLSVAEKDYFNLDNAPLKTAQLFEKYLPYALALGVEGQWARNFTAELKALAQAGNVPAWYSGADFYQHDHYRQMFKQLEESMHTVINAPGPEERTSSCSADGTGERGGFSGGGGGGGGGGGW